MGLQICPDCGHGVSDHAAACPRCGRPAEAGGFRRSESAHTYQAQERGDGGGTATMAAPSPPAPRPAEADAPHPWVRYWARFVDILLAAAACGLILGVFVPEAIAEEDTGYGMVLLAMFLWVFVEAMLLSTWGRTPGKALMGISVSRAGGALPDFGQALARSFRVWFFGMAIGVPLVTAITMLVARSRLLKRGRTTWDADLELRVTHDKVGGLRWAVLVSLVIIVALLEIAAASTI